MQESVGYLKGDQMTYSFGFDHDLLMILALERVTKKSESKMLRRVQHPGSSYASSESGLRTL
jgi:hypothetical protein